jgi:ribosomal protein S27E
MADISQYIDNDLTLRKMGDALIENQGERKRNYLGMSEIGDPCWRMLWYRFRNVLTEPLRLNSILAIEDGFTQERITANRLQFVKGIQLDVTDPETGEQFEFKDLGGHFCGHCDGKISGILESPKTLHIWEHKSVNEKKFKKLKDLIVAEGEKQALAIWDETYYSQAVIYMAMAGVKRHYLTVSTPGGRDYTSCRTEENPKHAISLRAKAETIITSEKPLQRLSENRTFYMCSWCRMKEICFDNKVPQVICRTCAFSEPLIDSIGGQWQCYKNNINFKGAGEACPSHLFLNTLVPFKTLDADKSGQIPSWIKYGTPDGDVFYNVNAESKTLKGSLSLTSEKIYDLEYFECVFTSAKNKNLEKACGEKTEIKKLKGVL